MADKQIGIKLDVKQTGLQQVDDGLDSISKSLGDINQKVIKQQQKGWGSEAQTKELREQLRHMNQMVQLYERMSRTMGKSTAAFAPFRDEIGRAQRDLSGIPQYRTRAGGWVQDRMGQNTAQSLEKITTVIDRLGSAVIGLNVASTIVSGLSRGDQLAFGYGDVYKRMGGSGSAMNYARGSIRGLNGYGYDDTSVLSATNAYTNATGRMDSGTLRDQMQAILSTGRRFGWSDPNQAAQTFGNAFSSGVTGGSASQMSPQQFATLVANATSQAHMQGRETQMLNQLAQVTQMSIQSMGVAADAKTMSAFIAMGDKSGNQALIGNLPSMVNSINQGIMSPSGGYGGQALMMRAIGGGKMGYWQEQYQQSLGAFGANPNNGKTNIENATNYLMKTFSGDKYRQASMLGQMFNMNPSQAMQFIDTYTKNGSFDSDTLNQLQQSMSNTPSSVPLTDTDKMRNDKIDKQTGADVSGTYTSGIRSTVDGVLGSALDNPVTGTAVQVGALGYLGHKAIQGTRLLGKLGKGGLSLLKKGSRFARSGAGALAEGEGVASGVEAGSAVAGAEGAGLALDATGIGALIGIPLGVGGLIYGYNKMHKKKSNQKIEPPEGAQQYQSGDLHTSSYSSSSTGAELAPIVASTIVALGPYMGQIRSALGGSSSGITNALSGIQSNPTVSNALLSSMSRSSGLVLASTGSRSGSRSLSSPSASYGSSSATDAISYYAKQYGVPEYVAYAIAMSESDLNAGADVMDTNGAHSTGLFQLNQKGQGSGYSINQLKDPMLNAKIGMKPIADAYKKLKDSGMADGPELAMKAAEMSGHPGYGVHSSLDDKIYSKAQGILNGTIQIKGTSIDVNIKSENSTQKVKIPISAEYTGIT